ncbi:hypothetical protein E4U41_006342 [Claviceps citrina]|nr:hypothetical protein E4U41_006342 [Claviceps citrina]
MRRSRLTSRYLPNARHTSFASSDSLHWQSLPPRQLFLTALERPSNTLSRNHNKKLNSRSRHWTSVAFVPNHIPRREFCHVSQLAIWNKLPTPGQDDTQQSTDSKFDKNLTLKPTAKTILDDSYLAALSKHQVAPRGLAQATKQGDTCEGVWEMFELLQKDERLWILSRNDAQILRDEVLMAALTNNDWLNVLVDTAHHLLEKHDFHWPDLYLKIMHHMLENGRHDDSFLWHLRLAPTFPPSIDTFGAILSSFIVNPSPRMQSNLTTLYIFSAQKQLYDCIIPLLFAAGCSRLARLWRKKMLFFGDFPKSNKSKPFLHFLMQYCPSITLAEEERTIAEATVPLVEDTPPQGSNHDHSSKGQFSDSIVAKWFASSWASIDFAIDFAQRLGLRVIGPRSLQSLALRESGAKMVALRLSRIKKLGITVSSKNYCKVLASFAKHEEDALLADLLACDIHPDEFDDVATRQMLMVSSVRNRDWKRQRLLQGIEWAIESEPSSLRLNALLRLELATYRLGRARQVLDRMEALKVNMDQRNASQLLAVVFRRIGKHPAKRKRSGSKSRTRFHSLLNGAIEIARRVALHNVAVPSRYWKLLIFNLGRSGRLGELEQLSEEIVQLYSPPSGGLIPICFEDLPRSWRKGRSATDVFRSLPRLSMYGKDDEKNLNRLVNSSSRPILGNSDDLKTVWSHHRYDKAIRDAKARPIPDMTTSNNSSLNMSLHTEACGNDICSTMFIPADLSLRHRQHPVRHIFDVNLQRAIIRWGFDQKLTMPPLFPFPGGLTETGFDVHDISSGVRLLARLRDLGVVIDVKLLRAVILSRVALGQFLGRERDRSRDGHEVCPERLKLLFDQAWGSEVLPSILEMRRQLEKQKSKLWGRYTKLGQSFDKRRKSLSRRYVI